MSLMVAGLAALLGVASVTLNGRVRLFDVVAGTLVVALALYAVASGDARQDVVRLVLVGGATLLCASVISGAPGLLLRFAALSISVVAGFAGMHASVGLVAAQGRWWALAEAATVALVVGAASTTVALSLRSSRAARLAALGLTLASAVWGVALDTDLSVLVDLQTDSGVPIYVVAAFAETERDIEVLERAARLSLSGGPWWFVLFALSAACSGVGAILSAESSRRVALVFAGVAALLGAVSVAVLLGAHVVVPDGAWFVPQAPMGAGDELGVQLIPDVSAVVASPRSLAMALLPSMFATLLPLVAFSQRPAPAAAPRGLVIAAVAAVVAGALDLSLRLADARPTVVDVHPLDLAAAVAALALAAAFAPTGARRSLLGVVAAVLFGVLVALTGAGA